MSIGFQCLFIICLNCSIAKFLTNFKTYNPEEASVTTKTSITNLINMFTMIACLQKSTFVFLYICLHP